MKRLSYIEDARCLNVKLVPSGNEWSDLRPSRFNLCENFQIAIKLVIPNAGVGTLDERLYIFLTLNQPTVSPFVHPVA
jgi:hypothetical protein